MDSEKNKKFMEITISKKLDFFLKIVFILITIMKVIGEFIFFIFKKIKMSIYISTLIIGASVLYLSIMGLFNPAFIKAMYEILNKAFTSEEAFITFIHIISKLFMLVFIFIIFFNLFRYIFLDNEIYFLKEPTTNIKAKGRAKEICKSEAQSS